jgi:hypothetical protein
MPSSGCGAVFSSAYLQQDAGPGPIRPRAGCFRTLESALALDIAPLGLAQLVAHWPPLAEQQLRDAPLWQPHLQREELSDAGASCTSVNRRAVSKILLFATLCGSARTSFCMSLRTRHKCKRVALNEVSSRPYDIFPVSCRCAMGPPMTLGETLIAAAPLLRIDLPTRRIEMELHIDGACVIALGRAHSKPVRRGPATAYKCANRGRLRLRTSGCASHRPR